MSREKGLGKGLDFLFEQNKLEVDESKIEQIAIGDIKPNPYQPRKNFDKDKLNELAESIKEHGVVQPILVRQGIINYEIISGERRYRASQIAGLEFVPCITYDFSDEQMIEIGIVENIQREDLSSIEEALAYKSMIEKLNLTQDEVSKRVGKSRSYVANKIRLLNLDEEIINYINSGKITESHARRLLAVEDKKQREKLLSDILNNDLNVRELENKTIGLTTETKNKSSKNDEYARLESEIRNKLRTKVKISGNNSGKIEIQFSSRENLEEILKELNLI